MTRFISFLRLSATLTLLCCMSWYLRAQGPDSAQAIYIILDGSGSMWQKLPDSTFKIVAAQEALTQYLDTYNPQDEIALRAYGHNRSGDCTDTELVVPFQTTAQNAQRIRDFTRSINPTGRTPIGRSLLAALEDIGERKTEIILISDGLETCDVDPCRLMEEWKKKKVDIKVHVVGLGLTEKEQATLKCISDISGGQFNHALSASEISSGLQEAHTSSPSNRLVIRGYTSDGDPIYVHCKVTAPNQESQEGRSDRTFAVPLGAVRVEAGIMTINGEVYAPTIKDIEIQNPGRTEIDIEVSLPPRAKSVFFENDEEIKGKLAQGFSNGKEVLRLRPNEWRYIMPGQYLFKVKMNEDNDLSVQETFKSGDQKEVRFELVNTVQVIFDVHPEGSSDNYRFHLELWQEGKKMYDVNRSYGQKVIPGLYDLKLQSRITPYVKYGLIVTEAEEQRFDLPVAVGQVTFRYQNKDGSLLEANDKRMFLYRRTDTGQYQSDKIIRADVAIPLMDGTYRVDGWAALGEFESIEFKITADENKEIILRSSR